MTLGRHIGPLRRGYTTPQSVLDRLPGRQPVPAPRLRPWSHGSGRRRMQQLLVIGVLFVGGVSVLSGAAATGALFSDSRQDANSITAKRIFLGTRVTSGFDVRDASSGVESDRTSTFLTSGDSRTTTTAAWPAAFASNRYLEFDMSAPLPGGLTVSAPVFTLRFASGGAAATACVYLEVRSIASGSVLATYGSTGSPAACVTGTTPTTLSQAIAIVTTSDLANDLRIRVFGRDSGTTAMNVDEARVSGSTPTVSFSLYPVRYTDAAGSSPVMLPWELQGP
jgi:hypothetical protein